MKHRTSLHHTGLDITTPDTFRLSRASIFSTGSPHTSPDWTSPHRIGLARFISTGLPTPGAAATAVSTGVPPAGVGLRSIAIRRIETSTGMAFSHTAHGAEQAIRRIGTGARTLLRVCPTLRGGAGMTPKELF